MADRSIYDITVRRPVAILMIVIAIVVEITVLLLLGLTTWYEKEEEEEPEDVSEEPAEMDPEMMGKQMELMGKLMSSLSELEVVMQITVPGDIVSSNAPIVEGRTSTWRIDQTNMMTAGTSMARTPPRNR